MSDLTPIQAALGAEDLGLRILGINTAVEELSVAYSNRAFFTGPPAETDAEMDAKSRAAKTAFYDSPLFRALTEHREALRQALLDLDGSLPPLLPDELAEDDDARD